MRKELSIGGKPRFFLRAALILTILVMAALVTTVSVSAEVTDLSKPSNNANYDPGAQVTVQVKMHWKKPDGGDNSSKNYLTIRTSQGGYTDYQYVEVKRYMWGDNVVITKEKKITLPNDAGPYLIGVRQDLTQIDWAGAEAAGTPFQAEKSVTVNVIKDISKAASETEVSGVIDKPYTGEAVTQDPVVTANGKTLDPATDYDVTYSANVELGPVTMTIKGKGYYKGTITRQFNIVPAEITAGCVTGIVDLPFTRGGISQDPLVVVNGRTLVKGTDYKVQFENHNQAGTATAIILGQGNYTGEVRKSFRIIPGNIRDAVVTGIKDMTYTGEPITMERRISLSYKGYGIYRDTDYTLTYRNNVQPGTATVIITGKTNFTGSLTRTFNIVEPGESGVSGVCTLTAPRADSEYAVGSTITVKANGGIYVHRPLGEPYEYTVNYICVKVTRSGQQVLFEYLPYTSDSWFVTASFKADVKGEYLIQVCRFLPGSAPSFDSFSPSDSRKVYVGVSSPSGPKDLSGAAVTGIRSMQYTGDAVTQNPVVKLGGKTLAAGTDYYVTYNNNVEIGTATLTVRGRGSYFGTITKPFSILSREDYANQALSNAISAIENAGLSQYLPADRTALQQAVNDAKQLIESGASAQALEKALARITQLRTAAEQNLAKSRAAAQKAAQKVAQKTAQAKKKALAMPAEKTVEKKILSLKTDTDPAGSAFAPLKLSSVKQTKKSVTLKWKAVSGASSYTVYGAKCGKQNRIAKIATVKGTTFRHTKLKKGTYYKYIVTASSRTVAGTRAAAVSKMIHVATKGGKVCNCSKVKVSIKKNGSKKTVSKVSVKKGKTVKLKAALVPASKKLKMKKHVTVRYESSDPKIASVSSKGKVKGVKKGTCCVFAYAQNGVSKKIKVTVK